MRILWVEDNRNIKQEQEQTWFGEFLQTQQIERIRDFSDAYEEISHKLSRYDLAVLDINLAQSSPVEPNNFPDLFFPESVPEKDRSNAFLEEAGFHLYLQLLKQGFPRNRVIFLTSNANNPNNAPSARKDLVEKLKVAYQSGNKQEYNRAIAEIMRMMPDNQGAEFDQKLKNGAKDQVFAWLDQWIQQGTLVQGIEGETAKNTYETFVTQFEAARLLPPEAYDKKRQDCSTNLQNWLRSHCERPKDNQPDYDYLTLRRGILDVITDLRNSGVGLTEDFQEHLDKLTFLRGLEWQLRDLTLPREDYNNVYFALCDYLTKPYDIYKVGDLSKDPSSHLKLHLKLPLSHLRNWIAHGLIMGSNTQISAQAAGVTFLIAMQSLFDVKHYGFQEELKRLFLAKPVTETNLRHQIKSLLGDYDRKVPLKALYKRGQKEENQNWPQENYLRHFYAAYLFSIQQPDYSIRKDADSELNAMVFHELNKPTE